MPNAWPRSPRSRGSPAVPDAAPGRSTSAGDPALPITRRAAFSRAICPAMLPTAAATPDTKTVSPRAQLGDVQ
jgi:hypothetical protein